MINKLDIFFSRPATLWGWLLCNGLNGIAIVLIFSGISAVIGINIFVWHLIVTIASLVFVIYSANYFQALEYRHDNRRFLLFAVVFLTVSLNMLHVWS